MSDQITLRDVADGWHLCALLGLAAPTATAVADAIGALLAVAALAAGHTRPAATLTATTAATAIAATLIR